MAKSPQFPCYARDLLVDTDHMSAEEFGAYWRLLCRSWFGIAGGEPCYLPDDDTALAKASGMALRAWLKVAPVIRALLKTDSATGRLYSKRLLAELTAQKVRSAKAREAVENRVTRPVKRLPQDQSQTNPRGRAPVADCQLQDADASLSEEETAGGLTVYAAAIAKLHPKPGLEFDVARALYDMRLLLPPLADFEASLRDWVASSDWKRGFPKSGPNWILGGGWRSAPPRPAETSRNSGSTPANLAAYATAGGEATEAPEWKPKEAAS